MGRSRGIAGDVASYLGMSQRMGRETVLSGALRQGASPADRPLCSRDLEQNPGIYGEVSGSGTRSRYPHPESRGPRSPEPRGYPVSCLHGSLPPCKQSALSLPACGPPPESAACGRSHGGLTPGVPTYNVFRSLPRMSTCPMRAATRPLSKHFAAVADRVS